jgi:hypothetical protein
VRAQDNPGPTVYKVFQGGQRCPDAAVIGDVSCFIVQRDIKVNPNQCPLATDLYIPYRQLIHYLS